MTSAISNKSLLDKCRRYIITDTSRSDVDLLIKDALVTSSREISALGMALPLAWNQERYQEIFTRYYAEISAITTADPGVITADSVDPDLSSDHGFQTNDIVWVEGINGDNQLHKLNRRLFRAVRASATTITLKTLDGQDDIDTSGYEDYDSGGIVYHAGIILPSTIEPSSGTADYQWNIKRVYHATVDNYPCNPISREQAIQKCIHEPGGQPYRWRYQQYSYTGFSSVDHILFWYPFPSQRYNIEAFIEKDYPDISTFSATVYPPHPPFVHDFIWHRALANLATHNQAARRRSAGKEGEFGDNTKVEVLNANFWISKVAEEERKILEFSRNLEGNQPYMSEGMSA